MILTENSNGTFTVDLSSTIKTTYNTSTVVKINDTTVASALPYTFSTTTGITDLYLELTGSTGKYKERKCILTDKDIECQILTKVATLAEDELIQNDILYRYFLIKESTSFANDGCACACSSIKTIYDELKSSFESTCC